MFAHALTCPLAGRIISLLRDLRLSTVGAVCALITAVGFVAGIAIMVTSGVEVLIPETGAEGAEWAADVQEAGDAFVVGASVVTFAGFVGLVALVGFWAVLREAGPVLVMAPILGCVGLTLVTISHALPIAIAQELAPDYAANAATFDTLASTCLYLNYFGNALSWAVVTPLYAFAVLKTNVLPRWVGYVGLVAAAFAGWVGLFAPLSNVVEGVSVIGFFAFFAFLVSMGITILRRRGELASEAAPVVVA